MARKHFKSNLVCSTQDFELTIRIHRELYLSKYESQDMQVLSCTSYILIAGEKIILKGQRDLNKARKRRYKIHIE